MEDVGVKEMSGGLRKLVGDPAEPPKTKIRVDVIGNAVEPDCLRPCGDDRERGEQQGHAQDHRRIIRQRAPGPSADDVLD